MLDRTKLITLKEIADSMNSSVGTTRRRIRSEGLKGFRVEGKGPFILLVEDMLEWYRECRDADIAERQKAPRSKPRGQKQS